MNPDTLTDEEIQQRLDGQFTRGPREFRGQPLAEYSHGIRALLRSLLDDHDDVTFHDALFVHVLLEAHDETPEGRAKKRYRLLKAAAQRDEFRFRVSFDFIDGGENPAGAITEREFAELRQTVRAIIDEAALAQVTAAAPGSSGGGDKKKEDPELSPATPLS